jgi:hypothetical protein
MNVALRPEASSDLVSAAAYFNDVNDVNDGWGDHFLDTIEVDLADLRDEAGIHAIHYGLPCKFANVFPFAIYYRVETESAIVYAILSCRMSPDAHRSILKQRV